MALTDKLAAIADAIRTKTGKTAPLKLADMPAEILSISGGGGQISATVTVQNAGANANLTARSSEAAFTGTTDANGTGTIEISEPGTYVISSNKKGQTRTVDVYSDGNYSADFMLVLYNAGDQQVLTTGGWEAKAYKIASGSSSGTFNLNDASITVNGSTATTNRSYGGHIKKDIDVTGYSKLCANVKASANNDNVFHLVIIPRSQTSTTYAVATANAAASVIKTTGMTVTLDFAVDGSYDIGIIAQRKSNNCTFTVTKIWLE